MGGFLQRTGGPRALKPNRLFLALPLALHLSLFGLLLAPVRAQTPLRIAVAADLEPVLPPILVEFRQATGIRAEATYPGIGNVDHADHERRALRSVPIGRPRLSQAPYQRRPCRCGGQRGLDDPNHYAKGTLVLWARKDSPLPPPSLDLLRNPGLKRLAIADPERAPYGRAALAALTSLNLYDALKPRLVTAENIAQAAQFVDSGNADAGLISLTSALTPRLSASGSYFVIPRNLYPPIEQGAVIVGNTTQRAAAHKLLDYLLSPPIQALLAKSGLTPVH